MGPTKKPRLNGASPYSGGGIRTRDLQVMSPLNGGHFDSSGARRRLGHTIAVLAQALDVDDDRLANQAVGLLARFADYPEARQVGAVGTPAGIASLVDDDVLAHRFDLLGRG